MGPWTGTKPRKAADGADGRPAMAMGDVADRDDIFDVGSSAKAAAG